MAQYSGHARFNLFLALPLLLGALYAFLHPSRDLMITFASVFVYSTLFMNPDLDLANQIKLFSIRGLFALPFRSYAALFSHRGLSHNLIVGSITRILWLAGWGALIFLAIYKTLPTEASLRRFYHHYQPFILYSFAAISLADWCHLLLDRKELRKFV
ncbi:MAG: hypothetical protein K1060chlam2_01503 [Chlamydiae bacterium]|nr:hypothetical protein [Chlamydiota bacterium]